MLSSAFRSSLGFTCNHFNAVCSSLSLSVMSVSKRNFAAAAGFRSTSFRPSFPNPPPPFSLRNQRHSYCTKDSEQKFDYFLILDFEATCDKTPLQPQEIIEFPCLKVNSKSMEVESTFHRYVQPRVNNQLTSFCTELTGIIQEMVDGQPDIEVTLQLFEKWLRDEEVLKEGISFAFVTCGDWDLNSMLPNQCDYFKIKIPDYMRSWINIKKPFVNVTGIWPKGLLHMMSIVDLKHQGRMHSGIDDCHNLAKVLKVLAERGYVLDVTGQKTQ